MMPDPVASDAMVNVPPALFVTEAAVLFIFSDEPGPTTKLPPELFVIVCVHDDLNVMEQEGEPDTPS